MKIFRKNHKKTSVILCGRRSWCGDWWLSQFDCCGVPGDRGTGLLGGRRCQAIDVAGWLRSGAGQSSVYIVGRSLVLGDRGHRVARVIEGAGRSRVLGSRTFRPIKLPDGLSFGLAIKAAGHPATGLSHTEMVPPQGKYTTTTWTTFFFISVSIRKPIILVTNNGRHRTSHNGVQKCGLI